MLFFSLFIAIAIIGYIFFEGEAGSYVRSAGAELS